MRRRLFPFFFALAAVIFGAALPASAKTYSHGLTTFMTHRTIGPDDVVDGDVTVILGSVDCDGGVIHGEVRTIAGSFNDEGNCTIDGPSVNLLEKSTLNPVAPWLDEESSAMFAQNERVLQHLAGGVLVLLAFLLFPARVRLTLSRVEHHPGLSAAVGILSCVAVVPVMVLLILSIIGIPLVALEIAALLAGLWIGQAAVALLIGRRLFELVMPATTPAPLAALVLGLVVVTAAEMVPLVGWAVMATVSLVGLGAAIFSFAGEGVFGGPPFRAGYPPFGSTPPQGGGTPPPVGGAPMKTA